MDQKRQSKLAAELESGAIQMVAGNLLRFDAVRTLLETGRITEATVLLEQAVRTQRSVLDELRSLEARLREGVPVSP